MKYNQIFTGSELMTLRDDPDNYLIEGLLWERNTVFILAREKVGKSILSLQMACALSCGESFLGEYEIPEPMPILYIQTESTQHETIQRLKAMTGENGVNWDPENFNLLAIHSLALDKDSGFDELIATIEMKKLTPKVIFIDPLYMSMEGSLMDDLAARNASRNIRRLGEMFSAAIVVDHHEHRPRRDNKGKNIEEGDGAIMGSFVWKAFPNHIIHLRMRPDNMRTLSCSTQRSARVIDNMILEMVQPTPLLYKIHGTADHMPYVDTVMKFLDDNPDDPYCASEIQTHTTLSISAVKKALMYLTKPKVNRIVKVNPGKRPTYYTINLNGNNHETL